MFSKRDRLPRAQFESVLQGGRRLSSAHFMIITSQEAQGYAVVIPKKVARLSTTRHQLKRRILEILRALPLPPALIVFPRLSASSVNYGDMEKELSALLVKIQHP